MAQFLPIATNAPPVTMGVRREVALSEIQRARWLLAAWEKLLLAEGKDEASRGIPGVDYDHGDMDALGIFLRELSNELHLAGTGLVRLAEAVETAL